MVYVVQLAGTISRPQVIGSYEKLTPVQLQVKGAATVTIARFALDLMNPIGAVTQGLDITANSGIIEVLWLGDMYAVSNAQNGFIDVQAQTGSASTRVAVAGTGATRS
jgi:hypothetical protein